MPASTSPFHPAERIRNCSECPPLRPGASSVGPGTGSATTGGPGLGGLNDGRGLQAEYAALLRERDALYQRAYSQKAAEEPAQNGAAT